MSENDEKNILGKKLKRKENDNNDINNNQRKSCYFCHSLSENFSLLIADTTAKYPDNTKKVHTAKYPPLSISK